MSFLWVKDLKFLGEGKEMSEKYVELVKSPKLPDKMSILELAALGRILGVDVDAIREKHMEAEHQELWDAVSAAKKAQFT